MSLLKELGFYRGMLERAEELYKQSQNNDLLEVIIPLVYRQAIHEKNIGQFNPETITFLGSILSGYYPHLKDHFMTATQQKDAALLKKTLEEHLGEQATENMLETRQE